jgi:hypothetical protein
MERAGTVHLAQRLLDATHRQFVVNEKCIKGLAKMKVRYKMWSVKIKIIYNMYQRYLCCSKPPPYGSCDVDIDTDRDRVIFPLRDFDATWHHCTPIIQEGEG